MVHQNWGTISVFFKYLLIYGYSWSKDLFKKNLTFDKDGKKCPKLQRCQFLSSLTTQSVENYGITNLVGMCYYPINDNQMRCQTEKWVIIKSDPMQLRTIVIEFEAECLRLKKLCVKTTTIPFAPCHHWLKKTKVGNNTSL